MAPQFFITRLPFLISMLPYRFLFLKNLFFTLVLPLLCLELLFVISLGDFFSLIPFSCFFFLVSFVNFLLIFLYNFI